MVIRIVVLVDRVPFDWAISGMPARAPERYESDQAHIQEQLESFHSRQNVYALESATESARLTKKLEVIIIMKLNYISGSGLPAASCYAG